MQPNERWLPAPDWEDSYEVSCRGQARSIDRWVTDADGSQRPGRRRFLRGRILRQTPTGVARHLVIHPSRPGENPRPVYVHIWVLTAFAGPPGPGQEARPGPGGSQDNRWPENLCWGTREENMADKLRDGTDNRGERHPLAKLTAAIVLECRRRKAAGESVPALAREFNVSVPGMRDAVSGRNWGHLMPGPAPE